jgi:hypothetical protein
MPKLITLQHLEAVLKYVSQNGSITNREFRVITGLGYDSAIKVFSALRTIGMLHRTGQSSTTKYVLPPSIACSDQVNNDGSNQLSSD